MVGKYLVLVTFESGRRVVLSDEKQEYSVSHSAEEGHSKNTQLVHSKDTQHVETNAALLILVEGYEKMKDLIQRVKLPIC